MSRTYRPRRAARIRATLTCGCVATFSSGVPVRPGEVMVCARHGRPVTVARVDRER
jgi:hypothetical protein